MAKRATQNTGLQLKRTENLQRVAAMKVMKSRFRTIRACLTDVEVAWAKEDKARSARVNFERGGK